MLDFKLTLSIKDTETGAAAEQSLTMGVPKQPRDVLVDICEQFFGFQVTKLFGTAVDEFLAKPEPVTEAAT